MKNKGLVLFWTDLANALVWSGVAVTGVVMKWVLPHGGGGRGMGRAASAVWLGLDRHQWGDLHFWMSATAVVLVILHLALHTSWILASSRKYLFSWGSMQVRTALPHRPSVRSP